MIGDPAGLSMRPRSFYGTQELVLRRVLALVLRTRRRYEVLVFWYVGWDACVYVLFIVSVLSTCTKYEVHIHVNLLGMRSSYGVQAGTIPGPSSGR